MITILIIAIILKKQGFNIKNYQTIKTAFKSRFYCLHIFMEVPKSRLIEIFERINRFELDDLKGFLKVLKST